MGTFGDWFQSKASSLQVIYRDRGLTGVQEVAWYLIRKPLREWRDELQWMLWRWDYTHSRRSDIYYEAVVESGRLVIDPTDPGISKELFLHGIHEPIATEVLKPLLHDGMFVADIGANIGYYVLLEASRIGVRGKVIALEPVPHNVNLLKKNVALNGLENVTVIEGAIGDHDGIGTMYLSDHSNWHSMVSSTKTRLGTIEVEVHRLDSLVAQMRLPRLDLIRMDIQGGEVAAVEGMRETLKECRPTLAIELHPRWVGGSKIRSLLQAMKDLEYECRYIVPRAIDDSYHAPEAVSRNGSSLGPRSIDELIIECASVKAKTWITGFFEPAEAVRS